MAAFTFSLFLFIQKQIVRSLLIRTDLKNYIKGSGPTPVCLCACVYMLFIQHIHDKDTNSYPKAIKHFLTKSCCFFFFFRIFFFLFIYLSWKVLTYVNLVLFNVNGSLDWSKPQGKRCLNVRISLYVRKSYGEVSLKISKRDGERFVIGKKTHF